MKDYQEITIYGAIKSDDGLEYSEVERTFKIGPDVDLQDVNTYLEEIGFYRIPETDRVKVGVRKLKSGKRLYINRDWQQKINRVVSASVFKLNKKNPLKKGSSKVRKNTKSKLQYRSAQDRLADAYRQKGN